MSEVQNEAMLLESACERALQAMEAKDAVSAAENALDAAHSAARLDQLTDNYTLIVGYWVPGLTPDERAFIDTLDDNWTTQATGEDSQRSMLRRLRAKLPDEITLQTKQGMIQIVSAG